MRAKNNHQPEFNFTPSDLKLPNAYVRRDEAVSRVLDENRNIFDLPPATSKNRCKQRPGKTR